MNVNHDPLEIQGLETKGIFEVLPTFQSRGTLCFVRTCHYVALCAARNLEKTSTINDNPVAPQFFPGTGASNALSTSTNRLVVGLVFL